MATGLLIGGTALSVFGQIESARLEAETLKTQAAVSEANAVLAEEFGAREEARVRRGGRSQQAGRRALTGATGVTASSFDPVLDEAAKENELDALAIRLQSKAEARGLRTSAAVQRAGARATRRAGTIGAAATGLTGAGAVLREA